ncbi:MAG: hypothetical protein OXD45_05270 [Rhodobacteraceae bacterium]|nr:hypothetical protein [Paracoccaceae bacterium]
MPVSAQNLVIPATTGTEACTEGGWSELQPAAFSRVDTPTQNSATMRLQGFTRGTVRTWAGGGNSFNLNIAVQKNTSGAPDETRNIGQITSTTVIQSRDYTFSSLEKNTRYVVTIYNNNDHANPYVRRCFKTRGEYTNAEQNLNSDGSRPDKDGRFGCFAVASTRQDIRDCLCGQRRSNGVLGNVLGDSYRTSLGCS